MWSCVYMKMPVGVAVLLMCVHACMRNYTSTHGYLTLLLKGIEWVYNYMVLCLTVSLPCTCTHAESVRGKISAGWSCHHHGWYSGTRHFSSFHSRDAREGSKLLIWSPTTTQQCGTILRMSSQVACEIRTHHFSGE